MIGFSAPVLTVIPFREAAERILPHFDLWEIISEADHFLPDIKQELKELLETSNVKVSIHAPYSDVNLAAFDPATRKYSIDLFLEIFEIASELDIDVVTIHPGHIGPIQSYDKARVEKLTRKSLEEISSHAREFSTTIALENMPDMRGTICRTADEMKRMLDSLDIRMCLDVGHANIAGQMRELLDLGPQFSNVHVHDNDGTKDQHLELGKGNIDFGEVVSGLGGYSGNFIIEARSPDMESAVRSKNYLADLLD